MCPCAVYFIANVVLWIVFIILCRANIIPNGQATIEDFPEFCLVSVFFLSLGVLILFTAICVGFIYLVFCIATGKKPPFLK